jgi:hypothetical protein
MPNNIHGVDPNMPSTTSDLLRALDESKKTPEEFIADWQTSLSNEQMDALKEHYFSRKNDGQTKLTGRETYGGKQEP